MKQPRTSAQRRSVLGQQIYDALLEQIVTGKLAPGAPIVEAQLREQFGVSRTPLREVLLKLADAGLATIYPQVGSYVSEIRLADVYEAQFVREHLECALVREAIYRLDEGGAQALRDCLLAQERALQDGNLRAFMAADEAMHAAIARIAGKPGVWQIILQRKLHLDRVRHLALQLLPRAQQAYAEHQLVCQAILRRDVESAVQSMRAHLRISLDSVQSLGLTE